LGQALVRFENIYDRDLLVNSSPHPYDGVNFSLVKHNEGHNWRALNFNRGCWIMMLGFPLDHWNNESIQNAIASFGHLMMWKNDRRHLTRLMVKTRVTDLQDIPHFVLLTKSEDFQSHSWTVQCEIREQQLLGGQPMDEDPVPELNPAGHSPMFDFFFWLGQPRLGPHLAQVGVDEQAPLDENGQNGLNLDLNADVAEEGGEWDA
jgi:hypothetical protein